jgi:hypothetical protein
VLDSLTKVLPGKKHSKNVRDGGTGFYMREVTTSRVMAADSPYVEFYDFYSVSPKYFEYNHVIESKQQSLVTDIPAPG